MNDEKEEELAFIEVGAESKRRNSEFMPRRSIWKGSFLDAFLLRMKKKRDLLFRRNSLIAPYEFLMEKLLFVVKSLKDRLVKAKGEFAFTQKRRPSRTNIGLGRKRGNK